MRLAIAAFAIAGVALGVGLLARQPEHAAAEHNLTGQWQISIGGGTPCPAHITEQHTSEPSKYYILSIQLTCGATTVSFYGTIHGVTGEFQAGTIVGSYGAVIVGTASADNHTITGTYCIGYVGSGSCIDIYTYTFYGTGGDGLPKPTPSPTAVPSAGLAFSIGIDSNGDTIDECHTRAGGSTSCAIALGSVFTLKVYLDDLPNAVTGYTGYVLWLLPAGVQWNGQADADVWPDCQIESIPPFLSEALEWGCINITDASDYTGTIGTASFVCQADGSLTLRNGPNSLADTHLDNGPSTFFENGPDSLTIDCTDDLPTSTPTLLPTLTPSPTPPSVGGVAFDASSGSAFDAWWLGAVAGAAFVTLSGAAAYAKKRP